MKIVAFPFIDVLETPLGSLVIKATKQAIHEIYFEEDQSNITIHEGALTREAKTQLTDYFAGKRQSFDLPLEQEGTAFQHQVWETLQHIPFGKTWSYLHLAQQFNDENLVRAVANANGKNQLAIVVPCHRVIATDGKLTGYAWGLKRKRWLIDFEAKQSGQKLSLF